MRCYECECKNCHQHAQLHFQEPYPEYGDEFQHFCSHCGTTPPANGGKTMKRMSGVSCRRI